MKKESYRNSKIEKKKPIGPGLMFSSPSANEGLSGTPETGIGRVYIMPGEPSDAQKMIEDDDRRYFPDKSKKSKPFNSKDLLDIMVGLSDAMDKESETALANFSDFLITKIAQQNNLDYSKLFKELLIKIVKSDLHESNVVLSDLVSKFNSTLKLAESSNVDKPEAFKKAYQAAVTKAQEYVSRIS